MPIWPNACRTGTRGVGCACGKERDVFGQGTAQLWVDEKAKDAGELSGEDRKGEKDG